MGRLKQLLSLGDKPAVRRCLDSLVDAGIQDIVVVTGPDAAALKKAADGLPVRFVRNTASESEMAESVRIGLAATDRHAAGVLVCLSDHPLVSPETLTALVEAYAGQPGNIIIPVCHERNGHPCLFPADLIQGIFFGNTLRDIIGSNRKRVIRLPVEDEGVIFDMDTMEDYRRLEKKFRELKDKK